MEESSNFYIVIDGAPGRERVTPRNYDIREVAEILPLALDILFGADKRSRPQVTYTIEEGSVKHVFTTAMSIVAIASQELETAQKTGSLSLLDPVKAKAIVAIQDMAAKKGRVYALGSDNINIEPLVVTEKTHYEIAAARHWYETELYLYGQLTDWGGSPKSNIHLLTEDRGVIKLSCTKDYLQSIEGNLVYKSCYVRVVGRQDAISGDIDIDSLRVVEIKPYNKVFYDQSYIDRLSEQATNNWLGNLEDPEAWLRQLRDYDE